MKKTLTKLMVVTMMLAVALTFGACGKKEEPAPAPEPTETETTEKESPAPFENVTYEVTSFDYGEGMQDVKPEDKFGKLIFGENGAIQYVYFDKDMNEQTSTGTYDVDGNILKASIEINGQPYTLEFTIDGDTLTITEEEEGAKFITVYTKADSATENTEEADTTTENTEE